MGFSNVVITGGAGFIGRHLCRALIERGARVTAYDDLSMGRAELLPEGATFVQGDVRDRERLSRVLSEAEAVFHLAARVSIRRSMEEFEEDADVNVMGTLSLLQALRRSRVKKVVLASSMAVYADSTAAAAVSEEHALEPISAYGVSKLASEKYLRTLAPRFGVRSVILRYFNTYGPGQVFTPYVGVVTIFVRRLLAGQPPIIFGDGNQRRDFVSVRDVVRASVAALDWQGDDGIFNVGTGRATTINQLAETLIGRLAPGMRPQYEAAQAGELRASVADISRARSLLGFTPSGSLVDELDEVIAASRPEAGA